MMSHMKRRLVLLLMILSCVCASAQIRNRLGVGNELYLKYANGRIRQFDESNILLADSIYRYGIHKGDSRIKMLALSLELPPRFIRNDSLRVREIVAELKSMANYNTRMREFYFLTMHDYCNMLILAGRISDAMLEARAMSSLAAGSGSNLGQMYAHRVIGLIQSYRSNAELAIFNFKQAADFSTLAKEEQELPVIYNLIAREYIKLGRYDDVERYCSMAEEFQDFYPSLRVKTLLTKVYLYDAQDKADEFDAVYKELINNPLYRSQTDRDTRLMIEICWLRSRGRLQEALAKSDSLASQKERFGQKHLIYAVGDDYQLNNARLRLEAQRLKSQQEMSIMFGFILLFMLVTIAILFSQWSLEKNLDNLRDRNRRELEARNAYRKALDSKELENEMKTRILQNRQNKELI